MDSTQIEFMRGFGRSPRFELERFILCAIGEIGHRLTQEVVADAPLPLA